ncbi:tetratricopeptide repeat protein, partial [Streptosporangium sp. NPDC023963]|uniref:P-loop NTPase n=1 Tax=Streptosporangium sp. NPDC023963 TaxID=3155608 RepID=UPI003418CDE8
MVTVNGPAAPGSGYVIAPGLVLTSAHVTGDLDTSVTVSAVAADRASGGTVVWRGTSGGRDDAALVRVDDPVWQRVAPVRWGRTVTYRPGIDCWAWGRPELVQRPGAPVEWLQPSGTINPGDRYTGDRYVMTLHGHPPESAAGGFSPWGGLSGAALWCGDLLAGVMVLDPRERAHAYLEAVPAYVLHRDAGFRAVLAAHTGQASTALEPIEYQQLIEIAGPVPATSVTSAAALLRARRQVVPFLGREELRESLHAWASLPGFGAQLVCAGGGHGKTRLAQQFAGELADTGWAVLWLTARASEPDLEAIKNATTALVLVVDYAESRIDQLAALLRACARHDGASPLKLLLLARTAGPWWRTLQESCPEAEILLGDTPVTPLPPLEPDPVPRRQAYRQAALAFADALSQAPGGTGVSWANLAESRPGPPPGLAGLDNALTLHMTALADLLDAAASMTDTPPGQSGEDTSSALSDLGTTALSAASQVEDRLLVHERRYWTTLAIAHGLHPARSARPLSETLIDALTAALILGAGTRAEADALLGRIPGLQDADRDRLGDIRTWIAALCPPLPGGVWGTFEPDRLAERWWGRRMQAEPGLAAHLAAAIAPEQAARLLTVYARAAAHPIFAGDLDDGLIELCMRHWRVLAEPAIQIATQVEVPRPLLQALHRLLDEAPVDPADLRHWSDQLPESSQALVEWAAHLTGRLTSHYRNSDDIAGLAVSLNNQSIQLADLGRWEEALEMITEAVEIRRRLAEARPDAFLPSLVTSLNNRSIRLGELGQREEALEVVTEAAGIHRRLAEARPDAFLPSLAASLNNRSGQLGELGQR